MNQHVNWNLPKALPQLMLENQRDDTEFPVNNMFLLVFSYYVQFLNVDVHVLND